MMFWPFRLFAAVALISAASVAHAIGDVALVTAVQGKVLRILPNTQAPLETFVKLKEGDQLILQKSSSLRLVYFQGGRQETWTGEGTLEIRVVESNATRLAPPEVKVLPALIVKQIAKTPTLDSQGRAGVTRLRSLGSSDALGKLEAEYDRLRVESGGNDLNAEIYMLSGLYELREVERVENFLNDLQLRHKGNSEAMVLVSLYRKAIKSLR
jgi:hypothetical protein